MVATSQASRPSCSSAASPGTAEDPLGTAEERVGTDIGIDPSTEHTRRPGLVLGLLALSHAVVHAQSALLPLAYSYIIADFALQPSDIGLFIAITTAVGGLMQLSY